MISLKNISKSYDEKIIENLSLDFKKGETTAILGPSGIGKTTLINIITGLDKDFFGDILGIENKKISVVFQENRLLENFSAMENIKVVNSNEKECFKYAKELGVEEFLEKPVFQLSGGMKRRVALARAFAYNGDVIVMDEPFKGIDVVMKKNIISNVKKLLKDKTCIFITHEISEAADMADRIVILKGIPFEIYKDFNAEDCKKDKKVLENYLFETECGF